MNDSALFPRGTASRGKLPLGLCLEKTLAAIDSWNL
jgi:hypothetical protein